MCESTASFTEVHKLFEVIKKKKDYIFSANLNSCQNFDCIQAELHNAQGQILKKYTSVLSFIITSVTNHQVYYCKNFDHLHHCWLAMQASTSPTPAALSNETTSILPSTPHIGNAPSPFPTIRRTIRSAV